MRAIMVIWTSAAAVVWHMMRKKIDDYDIRIIPEQPLLIRSKPIQVSAPPLGGSVEEIRAFAVDRPNSVDFLLVGLLFRSPATGYTWIAGNFVGDDLHVGVKEEMLKGRHNKDRVVCCPRFFLGIPKRTFQICLKDNSWLKSQQRRRLEHIISWNILGILRLQMN